MTITTRPATQDVALLYQYLRGRGVVLVSKNDIVVSALEALVTLIKEQTDFIPLNEEQSVQILQENGILKPRDNKADHRSMVDGLSLSSLREEKPVISQDMFKEALKNLQKNLHSGVNKNKNNP